VPYQSSASTGLLGKVITKLRRRLRKSSKFRPDTQILSHRLVQSLLGFEKKDTTVIDFLNEIELEYDYLSDIGHQIYFEGTFEDDEIDFFQKILIKDPEPIILDVGANIGVHTIKWLKQNPKAVAFAFEPSPITRGMLERNITRNHLAKRTTIIPQAVSDREGIADFFECDDNAFSSLKDTQRKQAIRSISVSVTTIDQFVKTNHITKISLLKIDVEGFETEVIIGALETLKHLKPDLFVEIYGGSNSNPDPEATIALICKQGYQSFILINGNIIPYEKHSDSHYNYYFTCRDLGKEIN